VDQGDLTTGSSYLQRALLIDPSLDMVWNDLGDLYFRQGNLARAKHQFTKATEKNPDNALAWINLGLVCQLQQQSQESIDAYKQALMLNPDLAAPYVGLGHVYHTQLQDLAEAQGCYEKALALDPGSPIAMSMLGFIQQCLGDSQKARDLYLQVLTSHPDHWAAQSSYLASLLYTAENPDDIYQQHVESGRRIQAATPPQVVDHGNNRDPQRPLKIGYVSGDFFGHSVSYFIQPILQHHSPDYRFYCYDNSDQKSKHWGLLAKKSAGIHTIKNLPDDWVVDQIIADEIDILVDLSGHTSHNRLLLFAQKPAPIQVSYLGYPNTTGLAAIDYRITDSITDPPEKTDHWYTESLYRLPGCFLTYAPPFFSAEIKKPPLIENGYVTFGSFNNLAKLSDPMITLWAQLLHAIPGSKLRLKSMYLGETNKQVRDRLFLRFRKAGIEPDRLLLHGFISDHQAHFELYNQVDIALDTWPYNGTTTTCEALWMGVPVISLAGQTHSARVGASLLTTLGYGDWIASSDRQFLEIARGLAPDKERLLSIRQQLRSGMAKSDLVQAPGFIIKLENCYRDIWQRYCQS